MADATTHRDFIADAHIPELLARPRPSPARVALILGRSLAKQPLTLEETADLVLADDESSTTAMAAAARELKQTVYGNRIVLFAPLYVGNDCVNDCRYCGFRRSNRDAVRRTLSTEELEDQVRALLRRGHKRLILVYGEHGRYDARYIADTTRAVYGVTEGPSSIRRININAAPLSVDDYRVVKAAGIGTYQIFMETYHRPTYERMHPAGTRKGDYMWRLTSLHRAQEGGCDDVGIGALLGLHDWRYEVLGLVAHALDLHRTFGVGCHTVSVPRIQPAAGGAPMGLQPVDDEDFVRLVAILRLAIPYTGLIVTAREGPELRHRVLEFGVSQIDAGSRIEIGGYTEEGDAQVLTREQFALGDMRPLDEVMRELLADGYLPSFCTACYRLGRTGEHFMEFAVPGFIKRFCTPNALTTLMEYLVDYASPGTRDEGLHLIRAELDRMPDGEAKARLEERLRRIREDGERDLYV